MAYYVWSFDTTGMNPLFGVISLLFQNNLSLLIAEPWQSPLPPLPGEYELVREHIGHH